MKQTLITLITLVTILSCNSKTKKSDLTAQSENTFAKDQSQLKLSIKRGEAVYSDMCAVCHLPNGKGVPKAFPPLTDSDYLRENQNESIKAVKYGMSSKIIVNGTTYRNTMPPLGLSDDEVADVMNYINNSWENSIDNFLTPEKVSEL